MESGAVALAAQDPRRMPIIQGTPILDDTDVMGAVDDLELMAAPSQQAAINYYQSRAAMQQAQHPTHVQMLQQAADIQSGISPHHTSCNMVGMAPPTHNLMSYGARAAGESHAHRLKSLISHLGKGKPQISSLERSQPTDTPPRWPQTC